MAMMYNKVFTYFYYGFYAFSIFFLAQGLQIEISKKLQSAII